MGEARWEAAGGGAHHLGDRPVYLLAAHLPHTDAERIAFLTEVEEEGEEVLLSLLLIK